jgi:capsular exopolysaccharide synthesis family protein
MNPRDYVRAIRRRWWLVLGSVVVALGVAAAITVFTPPRYEASVTFFVSAQTKGGVTDAYQGDLFSQQRVASYVDLLTSDRLARQIVRRGDTGLTTAQVQERIGARAVPNTVLLKATVTDGNRQRALRLTEELAVEFAALVQSLETPAGESVSSVRVEVIAGPQLGAAPVAPTPVRNAALGLAVGLIAGIALAALREATDTTVKDGAGLAEQIGAPLLAAVPLDPRARKEPLIVAGSTHSVRAEAIRRLRTNLQFIDVDGPVRTVVLTSAGPAEGKSTTVCNLAIVLAETGRKVLLVDADLRRPSLADYFGLEGAVGLTNVLVGQAKLDSALQTWGSITVLPSGTIPPNPSELLGSRNMTELMKKLQERFDAVIVDAPPLLPVTDAAVLASIVDGTVLVARAGRTTAAQLKVATEALRSVGARILGCVLNMQRLRGADAYGYYAYKPEGRKSPAKKDPARNVPKDLPKDLPQETVTTG